MAAKLSPRAEEILAAFADLEPAERRLLADGLKNVPARMPGITAADRHAELVRRVGSVRRGDAQTFSLAQVEESLRDEIDF